MPKQSKYIIESTKNESRPSHKHHLTSKRRKGAGIRLKSLAMEAEFQGDDIRMTFPEWLITRADFQPFIQQRDKELHINALDKDPKDRDEDSIQHIIHWLKTYYEIH